VFLNLLDAAKAALIRAAASTQRMSDTAIVAIVTLFCLWQCSAILFVLKWRRNAVFTKQGKVLFAAVGLLLACLRMSAYWYLGYRASTHTQYEASRVLWWSLLPDAMILSLMPLTNPNWAPPIIYSVLFVGSFAWAWPILMFTSRPGKTGSVRT
jgi:hypothetical protein